MKHPIIEELAGKRIAILGFGREGKSSYAYLRRHLPTQPITIADLHPIDTSSLTYVDTKIGSDYQQLQGYDVILKSPGIVLESEMNLATMNSQTNLFLKYYGKQTIGITGTKGKSTTSSLLHHVLRESTKKVIFLGNIGRPAFDALEDIDADTFIVFELSCHQLEYTKYDPHIAVLLNIYEEHLDHYGSFANYQHAKENVWRFQHAKDTLYCLHELKQDNIPSKIITISMEHKEADIVVYDHHIMYQGNNLRIEEGNCALVGLHNLYDIAVVYAIACQLSISQALFMDALKSFQPLAHRLQFVGVVDGIRWYDDSISTICETTMQALIALKDVNTLLLGGMDRGIDYEPLIQYLMKHPVEHVIVMPDSGIMIGKLLAEQEHMQIHPVADLKEAVAVAKQVCRKGQICLLSPAAASYGFFQNFEERGDFYQNYIKNC